MFQAVRKLGPRKEDLGNLSMGNGPRRVALVMALMAAAGGGSGCSHHQGAAAPKDVPGRGAQQNSSFLITPGQGVGPVSFGMTSIDVIDAIGQPLRITGSMYEYQQLGLAVGFDNSCRVFAVLCGGWCPGSDELTYVFSGRTQEGIGMHSSREEVLNAFGEPKQIQEIQPGFEVLRYPGLDCALRDGEVVHVTLRKP